MVIECSIVLFESRSERNTHTALSINQNNCFTHTHTHGHQIAVVSPCGQTLSIKYRPLISVSPSMFGFPGVMDIICEYKVGADSKRARAVESMCDLMAEARGCNTIVKLQDVTLPIAFITSLSVPP